MVPTINNATPNGGRITRIFIAEDDPDDQFIFKTAVSEVDSNCEVQFFLTSQLLIQELLRISIHGHTESFPHLIIGDMKVPFFELKDIAEIRTFKQFEKIPVHVFAESYSDCTKVTALELGATEFYHKPNSLHTLKDIFEKIFRSPVTQISTETESADSDLVPAE